MYIYKDISHCKYNVSISIYIYIYILNPTENLKRLQNRISKPIEKLWVFMFSWDFVPGEIFMHDIKFVSCICAALAVLQIMAGQFRNIFLYTYIMIYRCYLSE